ncbi:N-acetylmuramoyl-L-alanine amidase [Candidatus Gracilibacteria bacterium]|nr:N-acetylmuramoyl-L-alanine amidase [Candidatus Gracilibacteria bacterium]
MKFIILITILLVFGVQGSYALTLQAPEKPLIISRADWGADEQYTSRESSYWVSILERWSKYVAPYVSPEAKKLRDEKNKKTYDYINENFGKQNTITQKLQYDPTSNYKLAWPLEYTQNINAIVVHHTADEYSSSAEGIKNIYRYHSISNAWGDVGYNFVIGYDGEIYEGKKGGDYVSGAHSKWNNYSTLGIAVMGNYEKKEINSSQYESLEKLIKYLAYKYGIDFSKKYYYNMACSGAACSTFPLETKQDFTLVGHRDTGHTSCPGDMLYAQVDEMRLRNINFTSGFTPVNRPIQVTENIIEPVNLDNEKLQKVILLISDFTLDQKLQILERIKIYLERDNISENILKELQIIELGVNQSIEISES